MSQHWPPSGKSCWLDQTYHDEYSKGQQRNPASVQPCRASCWRRRCRKATDSMTGILEYGLTPPSTLTDAPMQVPPGPACSLSYLWETKKVLDMNIVSDCCTSSRSTSAMVHCSRRGSSSFLSPSNMPYTASTPSAKLPIASVDTHSLLENHTGKADLPRRIVWSPKPRPSGTLSRALFSQGIKATDPTSTTPTTSTAPWDVQLLLITDTPKPSLNMLRRGQGTQFARESQSTSARVGNKA